MPRVVILAPEGTPQPYRFDLDRQSVSIGRDPESDIIPTGGAVSTKHAVMERVSGGFVLRDLNSTNGTKLDGREMECIDLIDGMEALLGDVTFSFELSEEEKRSLSEEPFSPAQREKAAAKSGLVVAAPAAKRVATVSKSTANPAAVPAAPPVVSQHAKASSPLSGIVFVLLSALAIVIGLAIRHHQETGSPNFLEAWSQSAPPSPAEK